MDARSKEEVDRRKSRSLGILGVTFATVAWGLVPLVLKEVEMPTMAFASYRLWLGVVIYAVAVVVTGRRPSWSTIRLCALGASRWFGERFSTRDLLFMFASLLGVVLVALGSTNSPAHSLAGDLCAAASTISWTAYWLYSKRVRRSVSTLDYLATVMLVAAICVTAVTALSGISLAPPQGMDWLWVVLLAAIPGAIGHVMVAWSHGHVEAWLASLVTQGQPVVGSAAAWLLLGESLTLLTIVGGVVVILSTAVIAVKEGLTATEHDAEGAFEGG